MKQAATVTQEEWGNPGALGFAAFGLTTILLQIHNIGAITSTLPLVYGFFWGGLAQVIAGIIDGRRGDIFGMTAFISYGVFWIGLAFSFLIQWTGWVQMDSAGYGWLMLCWGVFTAFMTISTFKMTFVHAFVFVSLTILFCLLALVFFGHLSAKVAGIEGLFCGVAATYGAAAVMTNAKYGREVLPMGSFSK